MMACNQQLVRRHHPQACPTLAAAPPTPDSKFPLRCSTMAPRPDPPRFAAILVSLDDDGVGHLTLNRPTKGNSISRDMWRELAPGLQWLVAQGARAVSGPAACCLLPAPLLSLPRAAPHLHPHYQRLHRRQPTRRHRCNPPGCGLPRA